MIFLASDNPLEITFYHPVDAVVLKATCDISVRKSLQVDERKTITVIIDEIKNMLVGHYVHYNDITSANKQNVLRSFVFIKQKKVFLNGQLDKLKARLVADGSQQGRNLCNFVTSATVPYK